MTMTFKTMGLLCPIEHIGDVNPLVVELSKMPGDINTFTEELTVRRLGDDRLFSFAHGAIPDYIEAQLPKIAETFDGIYFETSGDFWDRIAALGFAKNNEEF